MFVNIIFAFFVIFDCAVGAQRVTQRYQRNSPLPYDFNSDSKCQIDEKCVPYYKCQETDGAGIFNIRSAIDTNDFPCESLRKCCEIDNINEEIIEIEMPMSCGYRNSKGLGGYYAMGKQKESQFGEFPWTMAILQNIKISTDIYSIFVAAGSLIHPQVVLSTAHNINGTNPNDLLVRGGEWNTQSTDEMLKHQEIYVQGITRHRNFTRQNLHNDIALLFLVKPFDLAPHINTICLPQPNYHHNNENCFASGWGKDKFGVQGSYQVFLKKIELPIVDKQTCQEKLRKTRLGEDFILHPGFMCAGGEKNVDTCTGDGGGALVCPIADKPGYYYQAGIVSWGIACNTEGVPGIYIDVMKYLPWINKQLKIKGF